MAKPTTYAPAICTGLSIFSVIGIILGFVFSSPIVLLLFIIPTVGYEIYRTEGKSTKTSSIILGVVVIAEIILIIAKVNFNLADFVGVSEKYVGGYLVPLGDIRILGPSLMTVLSVILFVRTHGVYTKWLSVIIFLMSFVTIYTLDPAAFQDLLKYAVQEGLNRVN